MLAEFAPRHHDKNIKPRMPWLYAFKAPISDRAGTGGIQIYLSDIDISLSVHKSVNEAGLVKK